METRDRNVAVLLAAAAIAAADDQIDEHEADLLEGLALRAGVTPSDIAAEIQRARLDPARFRADEIEAAFSMHSWNAEHVLAMLYQAAAADGRVVDEEKELLQGFAAKLGLSRGQAKAVIKRIRKAYERG